MLQLAIKEYQTIAKLKPNDLETHLLLGQLYGLNHDSAKAEAEFKEAQRIDGSSEEVVLNIARLYTEQGHMDKAVTALTAIPEDDRSARMEFALAGIYDQLKKPKEAAAAYSARSTRTRTTRTQSAVWPMRSSPRQGRRSRTRSTKTWSKAIRRMPSR